MAEKHSARVASFVFLERDGKILLCLRANTGYKDGMYQMPSGHIEENEYPSEAAIREAKEEVGVDIRPEDLEFVHASYCIKLLGENDCDYVNFFFRTKVWEGEPSNHEPDKCDGLLWASVDDLPENTVENVKDAIAHIKKNLYESEFGRKAQ